MNLFRLQNKNAGYILLLTLIFIQLLSLWTLAALQEVILEKKLNITRQGISQGHELLASNIPVS
ncbi:MAG TPA: hypothetical protein VHA13_00190 [Gammaproteobacteria bacterium]|nr:hypothetical protein [Gammaproteobacteria bacterium]